MKHGRRAGIVSALIVLCMASTTAMSANATQMQDCTIPQVGVLRADQPTMEQATIGKHKFQVAKIVINAKSDQVWNALTQYDRATEIYSNLKQLRMIDGDGPDKRIGFTIASMGGLWKYDYVLDVKEDKADKRITWTRFSGAFRENEGFWQLTPVDGDRTLVTYAKFIDGGMLLPQGMVNSELKKIMPEVMVNLRNAVMRSRIALSGK